MTCTADRTGCSAPGASHAVAARQQRGFGTMLSFELADIDAVRALVDGLNVFTLAEPLGAWRA